MINWNFDSNDYTEQSFKPIPVGDHRVRIASAEEQTSQAGNPMIKLVLNVSGYNSTIWHFIVLNPEKKEITNQRLGELFNSFGIQQGNFNLQSWVGKVGAAKVKHEDYKGEPSAKIAYFISKDRQDKLPAWQDGNSGNTGTVSVTEFPFEENLPFK
jgi:hypothetical protein